MLSTSRAVSFSWILMPRSSRMVYRLSVSRPHSWASARTSSALTVPSLAPLRSISFKVIPIVYSPFRSKGQAACGCSNHQPAVHPKHLPCDVAGLLPCQEQQGPGHFLGIAQPAHGGLLGQGGLVSGGKGRHHVGVDDAGGHTVDGDAAGAFLPGQGLGQADEAG